MLKYSFFWLVFILPFYSCTSTKNQVVVEKHLEIVSSYYQELIPGQESQKTKYNFYIKLENEADIIDSISYQNEIKYLIKRKNYYETDLGKKINTKKNGSFTATMNYESTKSILPNSVEIGFEMDRVRIPINFMGKETEIDRKQMRGDGVKTGKIFLWFSNFKITAK